MGIPVQVQVGPQVLADGAVQTVRGGKTAELVVQELHGRFYEQNYRGALFAGGMTTTSIANATFTTATLTASGTPIIGVYNPSTSPVNLVLLQACMGITVTAATNTGGGNYVWASSVGNTAVSTGNNPVNRKTLVASGSFAKDMSGVAMTGLTNALTVKHGSSLGGGSLANFSFVGTAVGQVTPYFTTTENFDGSLIVPPGGVLALMATTTPVAHSAATFLLWEEVPV